MTGAGGQLGRDLVDAFADVHVIAPGHAELDVSDAEAVRTVIEREMPDVVVHAAAWTDVDGCQDDAARAYAVNGHGAGYVAAACRVAGARLVMISTDYVFDGRGGHGPTPTPYRECDPVAPLNVYGLSKAEGERLVREILDEHHIVRTGWLSGARGHNFVRTMLRIGRERGVVSVVDDQVGSPTFTRDLAVAVRELAESSDFGTWHRTNAGVCSWFDLAAACFDRAGLEVELRRIGTAELPRRAARPAYSVLCNGRADEAGLTPLRRWQEGLDDLLTEIERVDATPSMRR